MYSDALKASGYTGEVVFKKERKEASAKRKRKRSRNIIWFNPPFSKSVATNIGHRFLALIGKHFPKGSKLSKIFNKNNVKVSYSCMPNMSSIIKNHNNKILRSVPHNGNDNGSPKCNCRKKDQCPMNGNCQVRSLVYNATVHVDNGGERKEYIGLTENTFKQRYNNHQTSMRHEQYETSTELSKYIWMLKRGNRNHNITWSIHSRATPYSNVSKRCNLCLAEKLAILNADKAVTLNKRSELVSKCRHENKFYLANFMPDIT